MKILSLYVENFGALHALSETFEEGFNLRLRPNGWGKSTLAVFVKVMLFGLPASTKRSLVENERKRYAPWQGGTWGGSLDIEVEGGTYRIERTLGLKESEDVLRVTDLSTGDPADTPWATAPGEGLFGVDAAAYERSTYLSQRPEDVLADGSDSIHTKLNRLMDATNDISNYDTAMKALDTRRRFYRSNTSGNGAVADLESRIAGLRNAIGQKKAQVEALNALLLQRAETKRESEENAAAGKDLRARREQLNHALESRAIQDRYDALAAEEQNYRKQANALREKANNRVPEEGELTLLSDAVSALRRAEAALPPMPDEKAAAETERLQKEGLLFVGADPDAAENLTLLAHRADEAELLLRDAERTTPAKEEYNRLLASFPGGVLPERDEAEEWSDFCRSLSEQRQKTAEQKAQAEKARACAEADIARRRNRLRLVTRLWAFSLLLTPGLAALGLVEPRFYFVSGGFGLLTILPLFLLRRKLRQAVGSAVPALSDAQESIRTAEAALGAIAGKEQGLYRRLTEWGEDRPLGLSDAAEALEKIAHRLDRLDFCREQCAKETERKDACENACHDAWEVFGVGWAKAFPACPVPTLTENRNLQEAVQTAFHRLAEYKRQVKEAAERDAARADAEARLCDCRRELASLLAPYPNLPEKPEDAVAFLRTLRQEFLWNTQEATAKRDESEKLRREKLLDTAAFRNSLQLAATGNLQNLETALAENEETQKALSLRSLAEEQEYRRLGSSGDELETLENELAVCEAQLQKSKENLTAIENAETYLEKARTSLSSRYLSRMKESFGSYIALLTGEEAPTFTMDSEFQVSIRASGIGRKSESFGRGMRDLIAFCERLSLVDAMFEGERPFLVLDDPFVNLDDPTVERAQVLLHALSERYQILYLSCSGSRA